MKKIQHLKLQVDFIKEGKTYIAYSPALDLSSCGKTIKEARKSFEEAVSLFIDTLTEMGTLREVLGNLGWREHRKTLVPPIIVDRQVTNVSIPAFN